MNDDCRCKFCTTKRLHLEETATTANGDDSGDPPGYRPTANARRPKLEPIPVEPIDWAELSALGSGEPVMNERRAGDGLVVNDRTDGGIPTTGIDWAAMSAFRPRG